MCGFVVYDCLCLCSVLIPYHSVCFQMCVSCACVLCACDFVCALSNVLRVCLSCDCLSRAPLLMRLPRGFGILHLWRVLAMCLRVFFFSHVCCLAFCS